MRLLCALRFLRGPNVATGTWVLKKSCVYGPGKIGSLRVLHWMATFLDPSADPEALDTQPGGGWRANLAVESP